MHDDYPRIARHFISSINELTQSSTDKLSTNVFNQSWIFGISFDSRNQTPSNYNFTAADIKAFIRLLIGVINWGIEKQLHHAHEV